MRKRDELERGCIARAADDEPVFVLRAQDILAPIIVNVWAELAELHGAAPEKIVEAKRIAEEMRRWPGRRYPT